MKSNKSIKGISNDTMRVLMEHPWPGNVRELKSAFEYAFVSCHENMIQPFHLPPNIYKGQEPVPGEKPITIKREEMKKAELIAALKKSYGNQTKAAEILGVTRVTVWHRMKKYGVDLKKDLSSLYIPFPPGRFLVLDSSGGTGLRSHVRLLSPFGNPVQKSLQQPGFLRLFLQISCC